MLYTDLPLPSGDAVARPAALLAFTEGPAVDDRGNVYFSDIANNRIMLLEPDGDCRVWREPSHRTNGNAFDGQGRLWHCEGSEFGPGGGRRITWTNIKSRDYEVVSDRYDGQRYNAPNDICADGLGRVWFTDPCYGDRSTMEMSVEGVYRIDADGRVTRVLGQAEVERPNGIAISQDGRRLYVIDSCPTPGGNRKVWSFDVDDGGRPHNQRQVFDFARGRGGDGMRLDMQGNLLVAAGIMTPRGPHETADVPPGIYCMTPDGELRWRLPIGEDLLTNLAFGGQDGRTLYITAGKTLYTARVAIPGQVAWPKWQAS